MLRRIRELFNDVFRQADLVLLALCIGTSLFGILMIASATRYMHTSKLVLVQAAALCIGAVLYIVVSQVDLNELAKYWKWIFLVGVVFILLLATPLGIAGDTGNKAWLEFPFLPVKVQPAEIVKLTFIIVLAKQLSWLKENRDLRSISSIVMLAAHFGVIFALYYKISSDMGSALVFLFIFACMCFVAGVALRWFLIGGGAAGLLFYAMWDLDLLDTYMKNRFIVLFDHSYDPLNTGWQQTRSLLTLGGGRIFGQGLFRGTQTQSEAASSLPHRHTDFIFSVIGEELGFVGALALIALFAALLVQGVCIALRAPDLYGTLLGIGIISQVGWQVFLHIGVGTALLPNTGISLPFFSSGGTSLLLLLGEMGVMLSISRAGNAREKRLADQHRAETERILQHSRYRKTTV